MTSDEARMQLPSGFLRTVVPGLLVVAACVSAPSRQTEIAQPVPCTDSTYVQLKRQNPDSLSERAWQRLQSLDRECTAARTTSQQAANGTSHTAHGAWHWMGLGAATVMMLAMMLVWR